MLRPSICFEKSNKKLFSENDLITMSNETPFTFMGHCVKPGLSHIHWRSQLQHHFLLAYLHMNAYNMQKVSQEKPVSIWPFSRNKIHRYVHAWKKDTYTIV